MVWAIVKSAMAGDRNGALRCTARRLAVPGRALTPRNWLRWRVFIAVSLFGLVEVTVCGVIVQSGRLAMMPASEWAPRAIARAMRAASYPRRAETHATVAAGMLI